MEEGLFVVDTNIFLEVAFGQARQDECFAFLAQVAAGSVSVVVSALTVHSVVIILCQHGMHEAAEKFMDDIRAWAACRIHAATLEEDRAIVGVARDLKLDFEDAMQYYAARKHGASIISLDKHFDRIGIRRVEPREVLPKPPDPR